ncbi:hypothetical protein DPMN_079512 [Dreissena polymorpha]|uniref:Uncharacterized protein n=1 Tax=Dreissena polymorpha TaxID=45954 RepID=A0A9D3YTW8_DREPO|nr:hypothetical protein DPMN_079512 [Dreissena polymorpha]
MGSNGSSHRDNVSVIQEEGSTHIRAPSAHVVHPPPSHMPAPPSQPPPAHNRAKLGRQMTPMPGRMKVGFDAPEIHQNCTCLCPQTIF